MTTHPRSPLTRACSHHPRTLLAVAVADGDKEETPPTPPAVAAPAPDFPFGIESVSILNRPSSSMMATLPLSVWAFLYLLRRDVDKKRRGWLEKKSRCCLY